jgi:anhydro-N-acetylmuramic acid kinase
MPPSKPELYIGLMSGTSMDGIDAALVGFTSSQPVLISSHSQHWPEDIQQALIAARDIPDDALDSLSTLDMQTAEVFATACSKLLENSSYQAQDITAIGNHGQTIRHRPDAADPFSLQIGNAQKIASLTDIDVISDFRTADIHAGGQGAPLAPAFHQAVFHHESINRIIVNIGGISNITILPAGNNTAVTGFDCGPGNILMDAWISRQQHKPFDADGALASAGKTSARLLAKLLMDEYFQLAPPKSTGFEYFNLDWLNEYADDGMSDADVQSTLCDLTATSIMRWRCAQQRVNEQITGCH